MNVYISNKYRVIRIVIKLMDDLDVVAIIIRFEYEIRVGGFAFVDNDRMICM